MENGVEVTEIENPKKVTDFLFGVFVGVIISAIPSKSKFHGFVNKNNKERFP